jgi:endoglucanase
MSLTINVVGGTTLTPQPETITPGSFAVGVNISGMEYGGAGAVANTNYVVPTLSELQYYQSQGQDLIRLPISWTTLQTSLNGALDPTYLANIESVLNNAASLGMKVIVDLHDYGAYNGNKIGGGTVTDANFADLWQKLSSALAGNPGLGGYDLMNEPNNMPSATAWTDAAQAAITAIRTNDMSTPIYVEGNHWANSYDWSTVNPGFTTLNDPANNLVFEAHVYLDSDDSGTNYDWAQQESLGGTTDIGVQRLQDFVSWLQANNLKGVVGEIGVGNDNSGWLTALDKTLAYAKANNLATTYWAGGAWWGSYPMSVEPQGGVNAPQMAVLDKYSGDYPTVTIASLSGTAAANTTVYLSENDVLLGTVTTDGAGQWSDTLTGLSNGVHIIVAGNTAPGTDGTISATVFNLEPAQPLCFTPGTRILTPNGERAVEDFRIGDLVLTEHAGALPIRWIGRHSYGGPFLRARPELQPVRIAANALADGVPASDLFVSPGHGLYIGGMLIPAGLLVDGHGITRAALEQVEYLHLDLGRHEILRAQNCPAESFAGEELRNRFHNAPEFHALYPNAAPLTHKFHPVVQGYGLESIRGQIAARAGRPPRTTPPRGPLRGYVDIAGPDALVGWAQWSDAPEAPVPLDVWRGGTLVARMLANLHRPDLQTAGLGSGRHGFNIPLPPGNAPLTVRAMDGTILALTDAALVRAA